MKIFTLTCSILISLSAISQNVGIGTNSPNASALLDVTSTTKGMLLPRMNSTQRANIPTPAKGLLVYDTDVNSLYHYNGSAWAIVGAGGNFALPYTGSVPNTGAVFAISNSGDGKAITGFSAASFTAAIEGVSNGTGGYGMVGNSPSSAGYGVYGISAFGSAVYGFSASGGVALRGNSPSGYALLTNGNIRLTGGNTNPSAGAVLTSVDVNGNAVWKAGKIMFTAFNPRNEFVTSGISRKIEFGSEAYDYGNGFQLFTGTVDQSSSVFIVPVSGVYHLTAKIFMRISSLSNNIDIGTIILMKNGNELASYPGTIRNFSGSSYVEASVSIDAELTAGDKIWVNGFQSNGGNLSATTLFPNDLYTCYFSGHLLAAD